MKTLLIIPFIGFASSVLAQNEEQNHRHEIGFNVAPIISPLFVEDQQPNRLEFSHLTHYNNQWSLRLRLVGERTNDYNYVHSGRPPFRIDTTFTNNTEMQTVEYAQFHQGAIRFHAGMERNFRMEHIHFYGGISAVVSVENEMSQAYRVDYTRPDTNSYFREVASVFAGDMRVRVLALGASPYIGLRIPLGDRFTLQLQSRVEYHYSFRNLQPYGTNDVYKSFRGKWDAFPLKGEIGMYWRF